jgi:hypothetical protein
MSRAKFSEVAVGLLAAFGKLVAFVAAVVILLACLAGVFAFYSLFPLVFWIGCFFIALGLTVFVAIRLAVSGRRSQ